MNVRDTIYFMCAVYPSIFPNRQAALNHLFCVGGNGYEWKDGELVECCGEYDHNKSLEWNIENKRGSRIIIPFLDKESLEKRIVDTSHAENWYPLSKYNKILTIPKDIKEDWKKAAYQTCILIFAKPFFLGYSKCQWIKTPKYTQKEVEEHTEKQLEILSKVAIKLNSSLK